MRVTEVKVSAVIPNAQYSNLQPEITVAVEDGDVDAATNEALRRIENISAQYAEVGKALPQLHSQEGSAPMQAAVLPRELTSVLTGESAYFDEVAHVYTNKFGQKFLSGSTFAEGFCPDFNADMIVPKMEAKYGIPGTEIKAMWECNANASRYIGNAIHGALELYGKYKEVGLKLDEEKKPAEKKWSHVHNNPILNKAVGAFYKDHDSETAMYEAFIVNNEAMLCGHIDRLLITGDHTCRVQDFKTNSDINKKGSPKFLSAPFTELENNTLNKYWLQLSFYARILELAGWFVEGLDIFHYDGDGWDTYAHPVVDITEAEILKQIKQ